MATYLVLNALVLLLISLLAYRFRTLYVKRVLLASLGVMLLLTLIFDNAIIASGIVAYDASLISGVKLFVAPVEDFAYTIAAVFMMPILWRLTSRD